MTYQINVKKEQLTDDSIHRYPLYLKTCRRLKALGYEMTESKDLERFTHIDRTTIRKDLAKLGKLGIKSKGYKIDVLVKALSEILGTSSNEQLILVGVGEIGSALLSYNSWNNTTGQIVCAFDENPRKCKAKSDVKIYSLKDLEKKKPEECRIAILCTSKNTQKIVDELIKVGIEGIVNFTLQHFDTPPEIIVNNVDLVSNIQEIVMRLDTKK